MITSPIRPRDRQEQGIAAAGRLTLPKDALRRFTLVRNHNAPMASSRHALTEAPQRSTKPHWDRPVNSEPRPCLISDGYPLSGSQIRTSSSDLTRHALAYLHDRYAIAPFDAGATLTCRNQLPTISHTGGPMNGVRS